MSEPDKYTYSNLPARPLEVVEANGELIILKDHITGMLYFSIPPKPEDE